MTAQAFLAFVVAAAALTITPGVDTAIVLRTAAADGARRAAAAAIGIAVGCLAWGAAASIGIGAILAASSTAFTVVRFAGAAYLVYVGVRLLAKPRSEMGPVDGVPRPTTGWTAFRLGLLTNLLNPKVGLFYVTFLPQFVPDGASAAIPFLLTSVHVALSLVWFSVLISVAVSLGFGRWRRSTIRMLDRITGCVFIAFGIRLAVR